jgi:L-threonylcarbamoyladenylate synthase
MSGSFHIRRAAEVLYEGGVIAYPTEGVYGLGCLPGDGDAVERLMNIKGREQSAGLILLAADLELLEEWIAPSALEIERLEQPHSYPTTWIVTAAAHTPDWLTGGRPTVAVRITDHPVAAALSLAADQALVSTSANRSGYPAARSALLTRLRLGQELDYVVSGALGNAAGPSEIRVAIDNTVLRPATRTL